MWNHVKIMVLHGFDVSCTFRSHEGLPVMCEGLPVMHEDLYVMCEGLPVMCDHLSVMYHDCNCDSCMTTMSSRC